jgi:hypothetical protein
VMIHSRLEADVTSAIQLLALRRRGGGSALIRLSDSSSARMASVRWS